MKPLRYYSEAKAYTTGSNIEFTDFVPREGPSGGRVVIRGLHLRADYVATVSIQTQEGEDMARIWANIRVEEEDGQHRWNAPGDASRVAVYHLIGPERVTEHADVAAGAASGTVALYIPFSKPKTHTPDDFALPADEFRKLVIQPCTAASWATSGTTIVITSISYYVIADCYEEHDLQFHCKDEVKVDEMNSLTEGKISINGLLHDLTFWAAGSSGGGALTNLSSVRIDTKSILELSTKAELVAEYRHRRGVAANLNSTMGGELRADPVATGRALPVVMADAETSCFEGFYLRQVKINMTNSVASLKAISRTVKPMNPATRNTIASAYGVRDWSAVTVKTGSKSKRGLGEWKERFHPYLPLKTSLPKAG